MLKDSRFGQISSRLHYVSEGGPVLMIWLAWYLIRLKKKKQKKTKKKQKKQNKKKTKTKNKKKSLSPFFFCFYSLKYLYTLITMSNPEDLIDWKSVSSLSAAIPQRKAAVTRACTKITKLVARPYNFSSPSQVENAQKELEQALALLQKITYRISDISPEHVSGGLKSLEEYEEKYEEALDKLAAYVDDNS